MLIFPTNYSLLKRTQIKCWFKYFVVNNLIFSVTGFFVNLFFLLFQLSQKVCNIKRKREPNWKTAAQNNDDFALLQSTMYLVYYRESVMRFWASVFFHDSSSPKPLKITLGWFQIFSKIRGDIHKSRYTTSINDTSGKFTASVNHTGGKFVTGINATGNADVVGTYCKFATGVHDTRGKFAAGVNDNSGKLPLVSTTSAANFQLVSTTLVAINGNIVRLLTPYSELEGKNIFIC